MKSHQFCTIEPENRQRLALALKALGHPVRLQMIEQLQSASRLCCGDICNCFPHSQSTVSQHLSVLVEAGLVKCCKDGNKSRYSFDHTAYSRLLEGLAELAPDMKTGAN